MIKKPYLIASIFIVAAFAFFLTTTGTSQDLSTQSLKSHAEKLWASSGHADAASEAFVHWDEDGEVSGSCAKCHSTHGAVSFLTTGSTGAVPLGTTVECEVCHTNPEDGTLRNHTSVVFPSGIEVEGLGPEAMCMECHQGRESGSSVAAFIAGRVNEGDTEDTINTRLSFRNIHYHIAAATQFGTMVDGGYEYAGQTYDARFSHVTGYNACNTCHNPHSLHVDLGPCNTCHTGVTDPHTIRYYGSFVDYDGDGDMQEGMYWEIETFKAKFFRAIQAYAREVIGVPIGYNAGAYPYWYVDTNDNGVIDDSETTRYASFSARLVKASFNYQVALKDPNAYAHGGKYVIQLMYDSMADLNSAHSKPVSMAGMHRGDEGHFNGSTEAWRHWDGDGEVSTGCAKCHSSTGLQEFVQTGENAEAPHVANGMLCTTCHFSGPPSLTRIEEVEFPSGAMVTLDDNSNYCLECHQGRGSKYTISNKIAGGSPPYSFSNIHYYPAGASLFGHEVEGGFEYGGKNYVGRNLYPNHMGKFDTCVECHMGTKSEHKPLDYTGKMHNVEKPDPRDCVYCHGYDISQPHPGSDPDKFEFSGIRPASIPDLNGNGIVTESIEDEILGLEAQLYAALQAEGLRIGAPIVYDAHTYPYFLGDLNGNGIADPEEATRSNGYTFTAKMLKAAYNYQFSSKEPHAFIHNPIYMAQLLVDGIIDLGGDAKKFAWRNSY